MGKKKAPTQEEQVYVDLLNSVAEEFTVKIVTPEYAHFLPMWKAVLGGFICRELAKYGEVDAETQAQIDQYTPEHIRLLTSGKTEIVEKVVEKVVEKKVIERVPSSSVPVNITASGDPTLPSVTGAGGNKSGVLRHKAMGVNKVSNKERNLSPEERAIIIASFNKEQKLVDTNNPICTELITFFPTSATPVFPAQVAGYWSVLCKVVMMTQSEIEEWVEGHKKKGVLPQGCPIPQASATFQKAILENKAKQKALKKHRQSYQAHMAAAPTAVPPKATSLPSII